MIITLTMKYGDYPVYARAARWLLDCRSDCGHEYEKLEFTYPRTP